MPTPGDAFDLVSRSVGALPVVNRFLARLRIESLLHRHLESPHPKRKIPAAQLLMALIRNLVLCRVPLYSMAEWARLMMPEALGLSADQTSGLNDDRVGRALDDLFDCDRQALLTDFVLHMIREFRINLEELHNDSTSLTLQGQYREGDGRRVRGKPTPRVTFGYNKDHRPDLKQLLWILTVSGDGAVPVHFKVTDGNLEDSTTHIETWNLLRQLVGSPRFLYVADSKLCTNDNLRHIDREKGAFITSLPQFRKEDAQFREWLSSHDAEWKEVVRFLGPGQSPGEADVIKTIESPIPEANGFRLIWFFSSHKSQRDAEKRQDAILRAAKELEKLKARLEGPRCRIHHMRTATSAVEEILNHTGCGRWIDYTVERTHELSWRHETRKCTGARLKRCVGSKLRFELAWKINEQNIRNDARCDGISPLVTNRQELSPLEVYSAYHRNHIFLELRHDLLKNTLQVTPAYIHNVSRLEAFLLLEYVAITVHALVERRMRLEMRKRQCEEIPLYPEARDCRAPTASRLFEVFAHLAVHDLVAEGRTIQRFQPQLTKLQLDMLDLLGLSAEIYECS
jgi:transposase